MLLGDLGAEVIKIERPGQGDDTRQWGPPFLEGESAYFLSVNRNKKSLTLDLQKDEGRKILLKLALKSDVFLENFRPGVAKRLGIDYEAMSAKNPRLIYCSISSFGQTGPYRDKLAYDIVLQAMGGLMGITGEQGRQPVRIGVALSDIGAGMYAAMAILAALVARQRTGLGQWLDISLLDGTVSWMTYMAGYFFATGRNPERMGSAHPTIVPYQCFRTADGEYLAVAIGNDKLFVDLCEALELPQLADDARFATNPNRVRNRDELIPIFEARFLEKNRSEWLKILTEETRLPVGPVYQFSELFADPQILHREMLTHVQHPKAGKISQIGVPMKFSSTPTAIKRPPPMLGEHVDEILKGLLGFNQKQLDELRAKGIV